MLEALWSMTGLDHYTAIFQGKVDRERMQLAGHIENRPDIKLSVEMTRRAELP